MDKSHKQVNDMLERNENRNDLNVTKLLTELLTETLKRFDEEKDKKVESNIQSFIRSRISDINNDETPTKLELDAKAIMHLIPLNSFKQKLQQIDIKSLNQKVSLLTPLASSSYDRRYNYDGYLTYNENGYTQVFRNGCIEAVSARFYNESDKKIHASEFERSVIENIYQYIEALNLLDVKGPFYIYITLIGVKDYTLAVPFGSFFDSHKIDKKDISLPRVRLEEPINIALCMKETFDVLWNAGGIPNSVNYKNGEWKTH